MLFTIAVPLTAYQTYEVEAVDRQDAIESVAKGEIQSDDMVRVEVDNDTNNWIVEEK